MIYFLTPNPPNPSGGVRKVYRQVDLLNRNNIPAVVVHGESGYRAWWFPNQTPIRYWKDGVGLDGYNDVVVVPEGKMQACVQVVPDIPKVIFNQSAFVIWPEKEFKLLDDKIYRRREVLGVMCVSELSRSYLQWALPGVPVHRIRHGIDPSIFKPLPKKPIIALMTRRGEFDAVQTINLARLHGKLGEFEPVLIQKQSEASVAETLGRSAVFLSLGTLEGFGLPPVEAMASECVVVGYHGRSGVEYMLPEHSFPVEPLDVMGCAQALQHVLEMYRTDRARFDAIGKAAGAFVRENYSMEQEEASILACWRSLLDSEINRTRPWAPPRPQL